jgi:hypothetical protein
VNGSNAEDMDKAWEAYLEQKNTNHIAMYGHNPRKAFEAGWLAAVNNGEARSSGWSDRED